MPDFNSLSAFIQYNHPSVKLVIPSKDLLAPHLTELVVERISEHQISMKLVNGTEQCYLTISRKSEEAMFDSICQVLENMKVLADFLPTVL